MIFTVHFRINAEERIVWIGQRATYFSPFNNGYDSTSTEFEPFDGRDPDTCSLIMQTYAYPPLSRLLKNSKNF